MDRCARCFRFVAAGLAVAATIGAEPARGQVSESLEIWGFMDLQMAGDDDWAGGDRFVIGQAEIDVEAAVHPYAGAAMALAFDPENETFGLGVATVEFRLWGREDDHRYRSERIAGSGLIVGRFDVPFGIDWMVYPSIDRRLLSGPLAVAGTHDGWNDLGVMLHAETDAFNGVAYAVDGFSRDDARYEAAAGGGWGGRLGWTPCAGCEVGASLAGVDGRDGAGEMTLWGADAQATVGRIDLKGEHINHETAPTGAPAWTDEGFYGQALCRFDGWYLVTRFERFRAADADAPRTARACWGAGWEFQERAVLRGEFQDGQEGGLPDTWALQLAVAF